MCYIEANIFSDSFLFKLKNYLLANFSSKELALQDSDDLEIVSLECYNASYDLEYAGTSPEVLISFSASSEKNVDLDKREYNKFDSAFSCKFWGSLENLINEVNDF